jgi:hypothetical protein
MGFTLGKVLNSDVVLCGAGLAMGAALVVSAIATTGVALPLILGLSGIFLASASCFTLLKLTYSAPVPSLQEFIDRWK